MDDGGDPVTAETVETTDDPIVAALYGAMAYPSLRPGITTAVDLVAGQTGPWPLLADPDRARLATDLVDRLRTACPSAAADPVALAVGVVEACELAGKQLATVWSGHRDMPTDLRHDVETLEQRLVDFLASRRDDLARLLDGDTEALTAEHASPAPVDEPAHVVARAVVIPSVEEAVGWRLDQWLALIKALDISRVVLLDDLAVVATDLGKVPPARLRDVVEVPWLVSPLIAAITRRAGR